MENELLFHMEIIKELKKNCQPVMIIYHWVLSTTLSCQRVYFDKRYDIWLQAFPAGNWSHVHTVYTYPILIFVINSRLSSAKLENEYHGNWGLFKITKKIKLAVARQSAR